MSFFRDLKVAFHSLMRSKGFPAIVILTLALGIGANAAIFTLVRGVLLKPLVNRDENRLIYIRQSAPGLGTDNVAFSVPEVRDLESSVHSVSEFGDFSQMTFTMVGLGEPRGVQGGVVGGSYFDVMGLRPVLGRLIGPQDDGPSAPGVIVLTYRFWSTVYHKDPGVIGKTVRLSSIGDRSATVVGVLEPSVPYPAETEIIGNMVTSPHHLSATMVTGRVHRMTELFGKLAPGATLAQARNELLTAYAAMEKDHAEAYPANGNFRIETRMLRDEITSGARTVLLVLLAASGLVFIIACSNVANLILARTVRREGELSIRAALGASTFALRRMLLAESLLLCGVGAGIALIIAQPLGHHPGAIRLALLRPRAGFNGRFQSALGGCGAGSSRRGDFGVCAAPAFGWRREWHEPRQRQRPHYQQHQPPPAHLRRHANRRIFRALGRRERVDHYTDRVASAADRSRYA